MSSETPPSHRRVLALDTATRIQSVALLDGDTVLEHAQRRVRFDHGSSLLAHLSETLDECRIELSDVDLIGVGVGPGSFTGLRVGLALAKALARADDIALVGVSSLAALAYEVAHTNPEATVYPMYDARRKEVYAGAYSAGGGELRQIDPDQTIAPANLRAKLAASAGPDNPAILVGDGPRKYEALRGFDTPHVRVLPAWADGPSAVAIALLGRQRIALEGADDIASLEPNYIRPTDAEINFGKA